MARPEKHAVTVVEVRKLEEIAQSPLGRPLLDVNQVGAVRTLIDDSNKCQKIFNLDPEPEKVLRINLNLDQLEDFEE